MATELDSLATALYVTVDDLIKEHPDLVSWRPTLGFVPELTDAELVTLAVMQVNQTFKTQLDLERHGGRTPQGVCARVMQRILALTATIWHNDQIGAPVLRSLTAYDH